MCSSKAKPCQSGVIVDITPPLAEIDGRPVLQPGGNRVPISLERRNSLKKPQPAPPPSNTPRIKPSSTPPISPKSKSPRPPALKRGNDPNGLNSSVDKTLTPRPTPKLATSIVRKKSKKSSTNNNGGGGVTPTIDFSTLNYSSLSIVEAPGSIAAARREQMTLQQAQRKMRIAHYGRTNSGKFEGNVVPLDSSLNITTSPSQEKRCTFITANSDPIYVTYHDEEWGVPVHDDNKLFELLVLSGAQVGTDWTSILKKRQEFKDVFAGFDADIVANFTERHITSISTAYGFELNRVRGVVDNSKRILEIRKEFGSFDKYMWGFVNHKPINTQYKSCYKMPVKTSKSEAISKDMVRRGFRLVGPTVMHSFMQAAGFTNDHLITCPRHLQCIALASQRTTVALVL